MTTRRAAILIAMTGVASLVSTRAAAGQDPRPLPGVISRATPPIGISGVVRDTLDFLVEGVEVSIPALQRRTYSGVDGSFRISDVPPGKFEVRARKVGYGPQVIKLKVDTASVRGDFDLVPFQRALPPVVTSAARLGLSGIVADTSLRGLRGAQVRVMGRGMFTGTDSTGAFYLPVPPGDYLVTITKRSFMDRVVGVTIPPDSGRYLTLSLEPSISHSPREAQNLPQLEYRLSWQTPGNAVLLTREKLRALEMEWAPEAVNAVYGQLGATDRIHVDCYAVINGGPAVEKLTALTIDDLESIEVYAGAYTKATPVARTMGVIQVGKSGVADSRPSFSLFNSERAAFWNQGKACPTVYVWTR